MEDLDSKKMTSQNIYEKLATIGITKDYLQRYALPDWWCDEYEKEPGAPIALASYTSKLTGLDLNTILSGEKLQSHPSSPIERTQCAIRDRYAAGESIESLADDYGMDVRSIEDLLGI
jgi:hypothetical protein